MFCAFSFYEEEPGGGRPGSVTDLHRRRGSSGPRGDRVEACPFVLLNVLQMHLVLVIQTDVRWG